MSWPPTVAARTSAQKDRNCRCGASGGQDDDRKDERKQAASRSKTVKKGQNFSLPFLLSEKGRGGDDERRCPKNEATFSWRGLTKSHGKESAETPISGRRAGKRGKWLCPQGLREARLLRLQDYFLKWWVS